MGNLPTLKVLLDDGTGTFPYNITSYVLGDDGYRISRGREDWQAAVTAGELSLTLNNSDGRFTPGSTLIASPTPIVVDRRIRLQEIVNGVTYTRFTGYVKAWPVGWPEIVATFAKVQLTATDAQARAERRILRSSISEEINTDGPTAYYTLTEPAASTSAGDSSGNQSTPLTITGAGSAPTFATGTGLDGPETTVSFTGGQFLQALGTTAGIGAGSASILVEICFDGSVNPGTAVNLAGLRNINANNGVGLTLNSDGTVTATCGAGGTNVATPSVAGVTFGFLFHLAARATISGGNVTVDLFRNGVKTAGTPTALAAFAADMDRFSVGSALGPSGAANPAATAGVSHFAVFCSAAPISDARILAHATVVLSATIRSFSTEVGTTRMTRIAGYAGVPVGTLDPSLTNVTGGAAAGSTAWAEIQAAADAEMGPAFVDGTGSLAFHNRNEVVTKTVPDLTLTSQGITPDVAPVADDQRLVNYMEVTAEGTGATSLVRNATSEASHGRYPDNRSYLVSTDAEAVDRANWLVANLAEPTIRYGTLTINLYNMSPAQASTVIAALEVDCWLRITAMAPQNPGGTTADVIVQGFAETVAASTWTIACNVVARSLFAPVWIFDTSVFDTSTRFYV